MFTLKNSISPPNIFLFFLSLFLISACSTSGSSDQTKIKTIGRFAASYDAKTNEIAFTPISLSEESSSSSIQALTYYESTGAPYCAIWDSSLGLCLGLVHPQSCNVNYNNTTHTLSFYVGLENHSESGDPNKTFNDEENFPPDTTFRGPFEFALVGLEWDTASFPNLVKTVNTNLLGAACGEGGLSSADDRNGNGYFDCMYPDIEVEMDTDTLPGWELTDIVPEGPEGPELAPGDYTGCGNVNNSVFMQYTLSSNEDFTIYFDVRAIMYEAGETPDTPEVLSPNSPSYANTDTITVSGTCEDGATVFVGGSDDSSPPSGICSGGTFSISNVTLFQNTTNALSVYQEVSGQRSGSVALSIKHDNIPPTITDAYPNIGTTSWAFGRNENCRMEFSEAMDESSFTPADETGGNFGIWTGGGSTGGSPLAGEMSFSTDSKEVYYDPDNILSTNSYYHCRVSSHVTDLAGNELGLSNNQRYGAMYVRGGYDAHGPVILSVFPPDNSQNVATQTPMRVSFSEPIAPSTVVGNVTGTSCSWNIPTIAAFKMDDCTLTGSGSPIVGATHLTDGGTVAVFTPDNDLPANSCVGFYVSRCVEDLNGNQMPNLGWANIGPYSSGGNYTMISVFETGDGSQEDLNLVHVGPMASPAPGATDVPTTVFPTMVFDQPLNPDTILDNYFFATEYGTTTHIPLSLEVDPSLRMVRFMPENELSTTKTYVLTATGSVGSWSGSHMPTPQTAQFSTTKVTDTKDPTMIASYPRNNGTGISRCSEVDLYFSEPLREETINGSNLYFYMDVSPNWFDFDMRFFGDGSHVKVLPRHSSGGYNFIGMYSQYADAPEDRAGNLWYGNNQWVTNPTWTTSNDRTRPYVTSIVPESGTASRNASQVIFFSEKMDRTTLGSYNFGHSGCNFPLIHIAPSQDYVVINCPGNLSSGSKSLAVYGARDFSSTSSLVSCEQGSGNQVSYYSRSFNVSSFLDTTPPTILGASVSEGDIGISPSIDVNITFSEAINPLSVTQHSVYLMSHEGFRVGSEISFSKDAQKVTLEPYQSLSSGIYYLLVTSAVQDLSGNNFEGDNGIHRTCFSTTSTPCP